MGKRKPWNPTITVNFVPFESEEQRDLHYDMWIETFLEVYEQKIQAELERKQSEGKQKDEN